MRPRLIRVPRVRVPRRGLGQAITVQLQNLTNPSISPNMNVGDTWEITITGPANSPVTLQGTFNGVAFPNTPEGTTDANGNFTKQGTADASTVGNWYELWMVNGQLASPEIDFTVSQPSGQTQPSQNTNQTTLTTASIQNTSRPGQPLQVGDSWLVTVTGAPNSPVTDTATQNGTSLGTTGYGSTEANGNFTLPGTATAGVIGSWTETWAVAGLPASPLSFSVSAAPSQPSTQPTQQTAAPSGGAGSGAQTGAPSPTASAPAGCFQPLAQWFPDPCFGPIGLSTLAAGIVGLMIVGSFFGGRR